MKKIALITLCLIAFSYESSAQVYRHSIGLSTPSNTGRLLPKINYQFGLSSKSRLDFSLSGFGSGFRTNTGGFIFLGTSAYYQYVWKVRGGLNMYMGAGMNYSYVQLFGLEDKNYFHNLSIGPQIGLEYDFNKHKVPLILSLDAKASFGTIGGPMHKKIHVVPSFDLGIKYTLKDRETKTYKTID